MIEALLAAQSQLKDKSGKPGKSINRNSTFYQLFINKISTFYQLNIN